MAVLLKKAKGTKNSVTEQKIKSADKKKIPRSTLTST